MGILKGVSPRHVGVIVACCLTSCLPAGMLMNTPGIFYPVIAEELGVQTAEISAWMAICLLSAAVFQPLLGNAVARFRMRTLMLIGSLTMVAVFLVFSAATAPWMFWAVAVVTGFPFAICLSVGPATLVNRWFCKHVGLLLGTCAACSAIGGVVFMLLGQAVIDSFGWRVAYLVYAAIILVVCVPAVLVLVRDYPADCGLRPFGAPEAASGEALADVREEAPKASAEEIADMERRVRTLMFTPSFALLLLAGFLMNMVCQVNGYLPKFVYWVDDQAALGLMPAAFIAGVVLSSLTQAGSAVGKFFLGAFSDFSTRSALVVLCSSGAAGIACVWLFPSSPLVIIGAFVFGFFLAAILVLVPMLVRSIFGGGELYPMLYARVAVTPAIGGAAANVVWPWMADNLGGFDPVFGVALIMMAVILASSLLALRLKPTA